MKRKLIWAIIKLMIAPLLVVWCLGAAVHSTMNPVLPWGFWGNYSLVMFNVLVAGFNTWNTQRFWRATFPGSLVQAYWYVLKQQAGVKYLNVMAKKYNLDPLAEPIGLTEATMLRVTGVSINYNTAPLADVGGLLLLLGASLDASNDEDRKHIVYTTSLVLQAFNARVSALEAKESPPFMQLTIHEQVGV